MQPTESAKYLGIFVDEQLSFKPHIIFLEKKIARSVGVLAKLSYYLPCNALINLYYSLVHTHLHYALPLRGATYKSYLMKLKRLQNKALRIISKTKIRGKISPQYYKYEILKLEDLYNFEIAKLMYQYILIANYLTILIIILHIHLMFHRFLPATPQAMTFFYRYL